MSPGRDSRPIEDDPTGMRALLASLPDPGPMPDHVVERIRVSLAAQSNPSAGSSAPLPSLSAVGIIPASTPQAAPPATVFTLRGRSGRLGRVLPWAAAAGFVGLAGGGLLASGGGSALTAALSDSSSSALSAANPAQERDGGGATEAQDVSPNAASASTAIIRVVIGSSNWSRATLTTAATTITTMTGDMQTNDTRALPLDLAESGGNVVDPASTPWLSSDTGARDCARALGVPDDAATTIALGAYEGTPAAIVATVHTDGERVAFAVGRDCRQGQPSVMAGPVAF